MNKNVKTVVNHIFVQITLHQNIYHIHLKTDLSNDLIINRVFFFFIHTYLKLYNFIY